MKWQPTLRQKFHIQLQHGCHRKVCQMIANVVVVIPFIVGLGYNFDFWLVQLLKIPRNIFYCLFFARISLFIWQWLVTLRRTWYTLTTPLMSSVPYLKFACLDFESTWSLSNFLAVKHNNVHFKQRYDLEERKNIKSNIQQWVLWLSKFFNGLYRGHHGKCLFFFSS